MLWAEGVEVTGVVCVGCDFCNDDWKWNDGLDLLMSYLYLFYVCACVVCCGNVGCGLGIVV